MWVRFQCMALVGLAVALACGAVAAQVTHPPIAASVTFPEDPALADRG